MLLRCCSGVKHLPAFFKYSQVRAIIPKADKRKKKKKIAPAATADSSAVSQSPNSTIADATSGCDSRVGMLSGDASTTASRGSGSAGKSSGSSDYGALASATGVSTTDAGGVSTAAASSESTTSSG